VHRCAQRTRCDDASDAPPTPHDASDALAVALCHVHQQRAAAAAAALAGRRARVPASMRSWRAYRPAEAAPAPRRSRQGPGRS
jgi:hypothetical protein